MAEPTPIDPRDPMAIQTRQALMVADSLGLLTYRYPVDMTDPRQVDSLLGELGPDAVLPDDDKGVYYLLYVQNAADERVAVLLPEGEVRSFVLALAVLVSRDTARRVMYQRSLLP